MTVSRLKAPATLLPRKEDSYTVSTHWGELDINASQLILLSRDNGASVLAQLIYCNVNVWRPSVKGEHIVSDLENSNNHASRHY